MQILRVLPIFLAVNLLLATGCNQNRFFGPDRLTDKDVDETVNSIVPDLVKHKSEEPDKGKLIFTPLDEYDKALGRQTSAAETDRGSDVYTGDQLEHARRVRDKWADRLLSAVDVRYDDWRHKVHTGKTMTDLGFDIAVLGVSGASAVTGSAATANILGAIATGLTGTQIAIDKNVFLEQTTIALIDVMDTERAKIRDEIDGELSKPVSDYSMAQLIEDVFRYQQAGTLPSALRQAARKAAEDANELKKEKKLEEFVTAQVNASLRKMIRVQAEPTPAGESEPTGLGDPSMLVPENADEFVVHPNEVSSEELDAISRAAGRAAKLRRQLLSAGFTEAEIQDALSDFPE